MAHRSITSVWTAVLGALVALLAALGLAGKPAPIAAAASASPAPAAAAVRRPVAVVARRTWRAMMRGGSLPPTIKQRIRAEAHGKAPSVRRSTTAAALAGGTAPAPMPAGVPVGAAPATGTSRDQMRLAA
ncbi:DUF6344 domain-containing protein [Streptomyces sp. APSN-46.1]|uniref:DUF6344 domain-containing protein n=1 Tax=Streptomyces sp. APSN-46.1 TaxID=2929049 RepID=UPI001FB20637|nr:DUF6344 domain-containing protein [Streptomyces sp. APSN-46.1]MCJ1678765.1 DUF6344 domain-containing protein [Streptomyces sp. APSN-46.1]